VLFKERVLYCLFNDAASSSDYLNANGRVIVYNEKERIRKLLVVALFEILFNHSPGEGLR
jgi:hypothetical protein